RSFFVFFVSSWFVVLSVCTDSLNAANWDRFRGPNGSGQSDDTTIPTKWEPANYLWKQPLSNIGHSSPVVWDDRLYLTSGDAKTRALVVSAYTPASVNPTR